MPTYTISNAKDDLTGMIHGGTLSKITSLNNLFQRAMRKVLSKIDPDGSIRKQQITGAVHNDINNYSAPDDLKGNKIVDIAPQVNREEHENPYQVGMRRFDIDKNNLSFTVEHDDNEKSLRLSIDTGFINNTLHNMNSTTENGTWSVGGDATNLEADTQYYINGNASLKFDLDGSGTSGYIEISDMTAIDLEDEEDTGKVFIRLYIPNPDIVSNVNLRWGSSSTAYWDNDTTSPIDANSFKEGWNILAFDWNGASETGSPDSSAVDYLRVTITYDGTADTDFRVDKIVCSNGEIYDIKYYSEYGFSSSGTWKATTSSDSDVVELDSDAYQIWLMECLKYMAQQSQGGDSGFDVEFSMMELEDAYKEYKLKHPSKAIRQKNTYYRLR